MTYEQYINNMTNAQRKAHNEATMPQLILQAKINKVVEKAQKIVPFPIPIAKDCGEPYLPVAEYHEGEPWTTAEYKALRNEWENLWNEWDRQAWEENHK